MTLSDSLPAGRAAPDPQGESASLEALLASWPGQAPLPMPAAAGTAAVHATAAHATAVSATASALSAPRELAARQHAPAAVEIVQARAMRPTPPCADLDAELLFVHSGSQESVLAQAWMRNVLDGARLHNVRFQENVPEQVLLRLPHIVFVHFDPSTLELATRLVTQLRAAHPHLPLVAIGRVRHPQCTLAALRCGAHDFLDVDGGETVARNAVHALLRSNPAPPVAELGQAPLTAVLSARGGLGSSLLASHLAWFLQQRLAGEAPPTAIPGAIAEGEFDAGDLGTLLIDLGYPNGDCSTYLDVHGEFTFFEAVQHLRRFDRRMAASGMARHGSGLRLLSQARESGQLREISYADVDMLVMRLRHFFRHIVADLGGLQHTSLGIRLAVRASEIWLVCDQSVASVVANAHLVSQLIEQKVERGRIHLIVARHDRRLELTAEQVAQQLKLPLLATIPERRLELAQAVNQGQLLPLRQRREPYVQTIDRLASTLITHHHAETAMDASAATQAAGPLGRFIQRLRS